MNPLDRLCELLDEHGVKYERKFFWNRTSVEYVTWRGVGGLEFNAIHSVSDPDMLYIYKAIISPEDAIAATVGRGTCHNVAPDYLDFLCSACGFVHYHSDENDDGEGNGWKYCPNCGRKVVK